MRATKTATFGVGVIATSVLCIGIGSIPETGFAGIYRTGPEIHGGLNRHVIHRSLVAAANQLAAEDCFMGECFRQFIVSIAREGSGVLAVQTRVEHYCGLPNQRECAAMERDLRALPKTGNYKILCKRPGGYVETSTGARVPEPDPDPPHATKALRQLWTTVCSISRKG